VLVPRVLIRQVERLQMRLEDTRKSSAINSLSFFGSAEFSARPLPRVCSSPAI
jgi:hypothetical protein